ncbi:hypothetical protein F9U64_21145 [Gracilibacillus oryzae]|uniref:DUF4829 domain-containing protein n=1 Tax=Gracilibacillus oryzae TaxID=1672701 RepID=A0A7C8GQL6_9BACI|nr:hypothetical protein [Gracilibacillus oryzae]KAB8125973.1 hypothetical protein F9U64_21145 [Gracilibacillus oryzae]
MKWLTPLFLLFVLLGCNSGESATTPEEALSLIDEAHENREIEIYGIHQLNEDAVLIAFRGAMNDSDSWVADVRQTDANWAVKEIYQMNGPFEETNDEEITFTTDQFALGYVINDAGAKENETMITIDATQDWRILIRDFSTIVVSAK